MNTNEDAQLISDVLQILPIMSEIYDKAITLKGKEITEKDSREIYKLTRELRSEASKVSLLPTFEDEIKGIDFNVLQRNFIGVVKQILPEAQIELQGSNEETTPK